MDGAKILTFETGILVADYIQRKESGFLCLAIALIALLAGRVFDVLSFQAMMDHIGNGSFSSRLRLIPGSRSSEDELREAFWGSAAFYLQNFIAPAFALTAAVLFSAKRMPNQAPERTAPSVTAPAQQEPRP